MKEYELSILKDALNQFLQRYSEQERNLFLCRYFFFDSLKEAAGACGFSESGAKTKLFRMRAALKEAGFSIVDFREQADVYVINTCSVTNLADRKSRQMISRAKRNHPDAVVVAAGCYVQTALDRTGKSVDADILIGTGRKGCLLEELERYWTDPSGMWRM